MNRLSKLVAVACLFVCLGLIWGALFSRHSPSLDSMFQPAAYADDGEPNADPNVSEYQLTSDASENTNASARKFVLAPQKDGKTRKQTSLGIHTRPVDATLGAHVKLPRGVGLVVEQVVAGSAAETADIAANDIVYRMDDQMLVNREQLATLVRNQNPGDHVVLSIIREGASISVDVELGEVEASQIYRWVNPHGNLDATELPWNHRSADPRQASQKGPHSGIPHSQLARCSTCHATSGSSTISNLQKK